MAHDGLVCRTAGLLIALLALAGCSGDPQESPLPDGVLLHLDQSRMERQGREVFLRIENPTADPLHVTRFVLRSERFEPVEWNGDETVAAGYDRDLEFELPPSRCGQELAAVVELTYRLGDGEQVTSPGTADDPHGAVTLSMDRDCARSTVEDAAVLDVGELEVEDGVASLPVTLTPTDERDDVRFGGFEGTPLFRQAADSPVDVDEPLTGEDGPLETAMRVVPARCDPHVLAEDKVGTLFGVVVRSDDLGAGASFHLPISDQARTDLYDYFRRACDL